MAQTTVSECKCRSEYQDKRYGSGNRLMNVADKKKVGSSIQIKCTVCGTTKGQ